MFRGYPMVAIAVCLLLISSSATARGDDGAQQVQAALEEMHGWLGNSDRGPRWKEFLKSDALQAQLENGAAADPDVVHQILDIYSSDTPGLERPRFVAVREALAAWAAELSTPAPEDLPAAAAAAKEAFQPVTDAHVQQTKADLRQAMRRLDQFLAGGGRQRAEQWKAYLKWDVITGELEKEDQVDLAALQQALSGYSEDHIGLEMDEFGEVRQALRRHMNAVLFAADAERTKAAFTTRLDDLSERLRAYRDGGKSDDAVAIGRTLGWLDRAGQSRRLVRAVRRQYWQPNLYAEISQDIVAAAIDEEVSETQSINDVIMGTSIYGTAHLEGQLNSALVPDPDRASFDILLTGNAFSRNVGYNGPVTLRSTGRTSIFARKRVYVSADGFDSDPARASARTSTNIYSISARSRLVRKIARKRAASSKGQAERIASGRAQSRDARRVDQQAGEMLDEAHTDFDDKFRHPLIRRDGFPQLMHFATTNDHIVVKVLQAGQAQLAAPGQPPQLEAQHDLSVRVHQSIVSNFSETVLGGLKLTDERLVEMYEEAGRDVPPDLQITPDTEPWAITFSPDRPINVEFAEGGVKIEVRCRYLHRGEEYPVVSLAGDEIRISADYQLEVKEGGIQLVRPEGDVAIDFLRRGEVVPGFTQAAQKGFLQRKFNAMLKPKLPEEGSDGLTLPGRWERIGKLTARQAEAANGWLVLGWERPATAADVATSPPAANQTAGNVP